LMQHSIFPCCSSTSVFAVFLEHQSSLKGMFFAQLFVLPLLASAVAACNLGCKAIQNVSDSCDFLVLAAGESHDLRSSLDGGGKIGTITVDIAAAVGSNCLDCSIDLAIGVDGSDSLALDEKSITCRTPTKLEMTDGNLDKQASAKFTCKSPSGGKCEVAYSLKWARSANVVSLLIILLIVLVGGFVWVVQHFILLYLVCFRDLWGRCKRGELSRSYQCCLAVCLFCPAIEIAGIILTIMFEKCIEACIDKLCGCSCRRKRTDAYVQETAKAGAEPNVMGEMQN